MQCPVYGSMSRITLIGQQEADTANGGLTYLKAVLDERCASDSRTTIINFDFRLTGTASPQKAAIKNLGFPVPVAGAGLPHACANVAAKASSRWRLERCADSCLLRSSDLASAVEAIDAENR